MPARHRQLLIFPVCLALGPCGLLAGNDTTAPAAARAGTAYRSPVHLCVSLDGRRAYVVNQTSSSVSILDLRARRVIAEIAVGNHPSHAALSRDGRLLYVTSGHSSAIEVIDLECQRAVRRIRTGHEPCGVTPSVDGARLYVASSISGSVSIVGLRPGGPASEVRVGSEPRYLAETPDGARLVVANGLSRDVSIIDIATARVVETRSLGRASILRQVACSPDGRWAFVAHLVSHDEMGPSQIERGWIHSNGFSVLDLTRPGHRVTLLLDRLMSGAANPWGLALSPDGRTLYVSLSGVHEVAIVDVGEALRLVEETGPDQVKPLEEDVEVLERRKIARRVSAGGLGPRGLALDEASGELLVANYFSDAVTALDASTGEVRAVIPLGPPLEMTLWRKGELCFNDARITHQGWFSCASCHQEDATVDGLNWDLSNDGMGNPKNVKSLHDIHDTPPAMWSGVREEMNTAVAAGQRFQGFLPEAENHRALMAFLGSPERAPNPYRELDPERLKRGEQAFLKARCHKCHPPPRFTDLRKHDLGLAGPNDPDTLFDTPSLRDCYRTAPYLHDGRARALKEIFTEHNREGAHGLARDLTGGELDDLMSYLLSL